MAPTTDPGRKPALLARTLDFLLDKPLTSLSFRTLAKALGVSTYTLVYHFGTRDQLIREIVGAVAERSSDMQARLVQDETLDTYIGNLLISWQWTLEPRNRQLQRIEFEAGLLGALQPDERTATQELFELWHRLGRDALTSFGLDAEDADVESRVLVDTFHGLQYDLIINDDEAGATAAFHRALHLHRSRIEQLVGS